MKPPLDHDAPRPSTPHWVGAYETRTGEDIRIAGTRAIPRTCRRCRRWTITGYDAPLIAGLATADPHPLTPALEAAALILARPTYQLWGAPGRYELTYRTPFIGQPWPITPANQCTVVAAHSCDGPLTTTALPVYSPRHTFNGPPPF